MKTPYPFSALNCVFIFFLAAIILALPEISKSSSVQKHKKSEYDSAALTGKFQNGNDLSDFSANDLYRSLPLKKFYVLYKNVIVDSINFVFGNGATKTTRMYKEVLSISICSSSGCEAYMYVKGMEIKKLFPTIIEKYFRIRSTGDNEIIFRFENPDPKDFSGKTIIISYAVLNLLTMEFHRQSPNP